MAIEHPSVEKLISNEEWDALKQEADHYYELGMSKRTSTASDSCSHVLGNLCSGLILIRSHEMPDDPEKRSKQYASAMESIDYIKKYLGLLDDFPEFAEKELGPGSGYFPHLLGHIGSMDLVDRYEQELRGIGR